MKNKKRTKQVNDEQRLEESLAVIFDKSDNIHFEVSKEGIVIILLEQKHFVQRIFRRLGMDIPLYRRVRLDAKSSFVFNHIDGRKNVEDLGELLKTEFGEEVYPIYPRLLTFLNQLEEQYRYIKRV